MVVGAAEGPVADQENGTGGDIFVDEPALANADPGDATVLHVATPPGQEPWVLAATQALLGGKTKDSPARVAAAQALMSDVTAAEVTVTAKVTEVGTPESPGGGPDLLVPVTFTPTAVVAGAKKPPPPWTSRFAVGVTCAMEPPALGSEWLMFLTDEGLGLDLTAGVSPRRVEAGGLPLFPGEEPVLLSVVAAAAKAADEEAAP